MKNTAQVDRSWVAIVTRAGIPFSQFHPQGHYQQNAESRGSWGCAASSWQRGTDRSVGSNLYLHDSQQMVIALPEEGPDNAFKIPATHMKQIPGELCQNHTK